MSNVALAESPETTQSAASPKRSKAAKSASRPPASAEAGQAKASAQLLKSAGLDLTHTSVWIGSASGSPLVQHRAEAWVNPASVMKLVTTAAALQTLGPQHTWQTGVGVQGQIKPGTRTLQGNLVLRGGGDPKLVVERLEPLMRRIRDSGIDVIEGDILLDRRAFVVPEMDPGEFDGEPLKPYNARPDPLLINFKSVVVYFKPNADAISAEVRYEPPLAGLAVQPAVPISRKRCGDWRATLGADFSDPNSIRFAGSYPLACGERIWPVAYAEPASHSARAVAAMWTQVGGTLKGKVQTLGVSAAPGATPVQPLFQFASVPLSEVLRDVNKYSNNVMAQHMFLALPKASGYTESASASVTLSDARRATTRWWETALPGVPLPVLDNGSGLSRDERVTAFSIGKLLARMRQSDQADLFFDSLPVAGMDGTLGSLRGASIQGLAQLKTGSLRDATALAGRVTTTSGEERLFVALYNGNRTQEARQAMYCLVQRVAFGSSKPTEGRTMCKR